MNKEEKSNKDCINIILEILNGRSVWSSFQILEDAKHQIEIEAVFKENKSKR